MKSNPHKHADVQSNPRKTSLRRRTAALFEALEPRQLMSAVVVNTTVDAIFPPSTGLISLRSAIATADTSTSATTITFSPTVFATAQTIQLNGNQLELSNTSKAITITGPAAGVTINANNASTGIVIDSKVTAALSNLVITKAADGGIDNNGILTLTNDTITANNDPNSAPDSHSGGGLTDTGTITLTDVTISNNTDTNGDFSSAGGIFVWSGGSATMTNVTIYGNSDNSLGGGGVYIDTGCTATMTNVTVVDNTAAGSGGGVFASTNGVANISNSIIANNTGKTADPDVYGNFASIGYNLIGKTDGSSGFNTLDLTGTVAKPLNAKLGSLASNGGFTATVLPLSGSPAIGAGLAAYVPKGVTTDQRGLPRIVSGKVDIGAVELQPTVVTSLVVTPPAAQTALTSATKSFTLGSLAESNAISPYSVDVSWGDGSTNSIFAMTAAGTIPAQTHVYSKVATDTVSITVTDAAGHKSNTATFKVTVTAGGTISGLVFDDVNGNGARDSHESGLGLFTVYIDANNNGKLDSTEQSVVTTVQGAWSFSGLAAGTYTIRIVPITGFKSTKPTTGVLTIKLTAGQLSTGNLFAEQST